MGRRSLLIVGALAFGCVELVEPRAPIPVHGAGCAEACEVLESLGCPLPVSRSCVDACRSANSHRDDMGNPIVTVDTECIAAAGTCDDAWRCR